MSIESDAASQVAGIYTKGLEEAARLAAKGVEGTAQIAIKVGGEVFKISGELAVIIFRAIAFKDFQRSGRISLHNMLRKASQSGTELHILQINTKEEFDKVAAEFKGCNVLFAQGRGKNNYNIIFGEDNAPLVNRALENLGIHVIDGKITSEVKQVKDKSANIDEIDLDNGDFQIEPDPNVYKRSVDDKTEKVVNGSDFKTEDKFTEDLKNDYTAEKALNLDEAKEYNNPDQLAKDIQKAQRGKERPLAKDGEAAAPSKKRSAAEKSSDKGKISIHKKLNDKKAERAVKAASAKETIGKVKDGAEKAAEAIKESGGK